jgi:hypothetical protein
LRKGIKIRIDKDFVEIELKGLNKLWAFKKNIKIPKKAIRKIYVKPKNLKPPWLRCPGTYVPKVIIAGTYYGYGRKEFWFTRFKNSIVFDLSNFEYTRVVVDVENPSEIFELINKHQ